MLQQASLCGRFLVSDIPPTHEILAGSKWSRYLTNSFRVAARDLNRNAVGLEGDYLMTKKGNADAFEIELRQSVLSYLKNREVDELIRIDFFSLEGKEVCELTVAKSPVPIILYDAGIQECYVRVGNSSKPYPFNEFLEYCNRQKS